MNMKVGCTYCDRPAQFVAAQSIDQGHTITWHAICASHADGWNEGGDWDAPVVPLKRDVAGFCTPRTYADFVKHMPLYMD